MRKVTRNVCNAFINGNVYSEQNSCTDGTNLLLHGNLIAWKLDGDVYVTLAGWPTRTTQERLNGLCELLGLGRPFCQIKKQPHYQDIPICDDDIVCITSGTVCPDLMS